MCNNLSWSEHVKFITSKAYRALHLIRRTFSTPSTSLRLQLYLSLVRSQLCYCSPIWRPRLLKDVICLEQIQRRATKYILNDYSSDYKSRLRSLHLLPFMHWLEFLDIMFLVKCIKAPPDNFDIFSYVSFVNTCTRASTSMKLKHNYCRLSTTRHFYFNRIVLLWNHIPSFDFALSFSAIRRHVLNFFWNHF